MQEKKSVYNGTYMKNKFSLTTMCIDMLFIFQVKRKKRKTSVKQNKNKKTAGCFSRSMKNLNGP